jgi:hypothetical protein
MWPEDKMPNPIGGKRLTDLGCKVTYQKSHLVEPRKIRTQEDMRPGTKKGKLDRNPIWIVEVQMPKKIAFDIYKGYMSKMKNEYAPEGQQQESTAPASIAAPAPAAPTAAPAAPAAPTTPSSGGGGAAPTGL